MKTINQVNGIPLHYARLTNHPYGTRGQQRNFLIDEGFLNTLQKALQEVFEHCPLGIPEVLTTAGIFVDKPGQHGHGKAFDIDAIFWNNETLVTTNFIHQKELYLGIESFLRKHFGIVLNYYYPNHKDHWHVDTSVPVDYNESSKSETLYLQLVLKYIYREEILVDGIWGRQTSGVVKEVFEKLGIKTPITTKANYLKFLDSTGKIAFKLYEQKTSPRHLLNNLTEVIEGLPQQNKLAVREALNSFLDHSETATWLDDFEDVHDLESVIEEIIT
ncbi:hypothetical protein P8625_08440 [Tenacibaculum tangerinum]|uniref:Extensin-like C-terminal domain-containing protein n=1 Tax=Tenacibaculum tangerinum TaxID=3038772 RepID=A0ABY8L1C8_9FLAO|nr:hypothetical protein [Tenacibaculum tangerinum]WGH74148.1 hypothetical protein P8625_08440 [Tenacibaculum tangerinum]